MCHQNSLLQARELVRFHTQLQDEGARYKNEIHALLAVLFPELSHVFLDPCRPTALGLLKRYPSAQAIAEAGVKAITATLHELAPRHYGRKTAEQLVLLAQQSVSSQIATSARSMSLKILCDQLEHTQKNVAQLESEIDKLVEGDDGVKGLKSVPEDAAQNDRCLASRVRRGDALSAH